MALNQLPNNCLISEQPKSSLMQMIATVYAVTSNGAGYDIQLHIHIFRTLLLIGYFCYFRTKFCPLIILFSEKNMNIIAAVLKILTFNTMCTKGIDDLVTSQTVFTYVDGTCDMFGYFNR